MTHSKDARRRHRVAWALAAILSTGCGAASAHTETAAHADPTVFFATRVPLGNDGQSSAVYVVIDETRGAETAATGEPIALGDDGSMAASARPVDLARLDARLRTLAEAHFTALGAHCAGPLGAVVELTLRDARESARDEPLASVLAAPLEGPCDGDPRAVYVEDAPPERTYRLDSAVNVDAYFDRRARAEMLTLVHALPEYVQGDEDAADADSPTFEVLRDGAGHELVRITVSVGDASLTAITERVDGHHVLRASGPATHGLVLDVEGDGTLQLIDRLGLVEGGAYERHFERAPLASRE